LRPSYERRGALLLHSRCARESRLQGGISHAPDLKPSENKINRSRENELYPGPAVGERCDLIGGKIGGKAPRRRRSSARRNYSSGAIVCCMDGTPRRSPDLFQQWRAIISLIAYETAEPVSCD